MSTSNINPNVNASGVNIPSTIRSRRRKRRIPKTPGSASVSASSATTTTTTTCKLSSSRKSLKIISEDDEFRFGIQKASSLDFGTPKSEVSEQSLESNHDDSFVFDDVSPKVLSYPSSRHARQQLKQKRKTVNTDTDTKRLSSVFTFDDDDDNKTFMEAEVVSAGKAKKPSSMLEPFSPLGSFPMTPSPVPTSKTDSTDRLKDSFDKNDSKSKSQPKPNKQRPKAKTTAQTDDNSSFDYLPEKVSSLVYSTKTARRAPGQTPSVQNSAPKISNTKNNVNNRKLASRSCYGARNNNNTVTKKRRSSKDLSPQDTTPSPSPSIRQHLQNNNGLSSSPNFGLFSASQESDGIIEEIKGISTDVYAVQDAGSYRQTCEHCLYLCSTISSVIDHSQNSTSQSHQQGIFSPLKNRRSHTISACTTLSSPQSPAILKRHYSISPPVPASSTRRRRRRLGFDDVNEVSVGKHTNITANSACELAYMLSKKQERSNLLSSTMNNTTSTSTGTNTTIHCILEALASVPDPHKTTVYGREVVGTNKRQEQEIHDESLEEKSPFARKDDKLFSSSPKKVSAMMDFDTSPPLVPHSKQQDQDENSMTVSTPKKKNSSKKKSLTLLRTKSSRIKKQPTNNKSDVEKGNIPTMNKNLKSSNKDHTTTQPQTTSSSPHDKNQDDSSSLLEYDNDYRASLALSAITHFISLECCTSRNSSTRKSNSSKRTSSIIRNCVLNHHDALLGISRLILYDTFMHLPSAIHGEEQNKKETNRQEEKQEILQGSKNSSTNSDNADNQTSTQSKKRSLDNNISSEVDKEEIDSNTDDSIGAGDPTARGRRKRKNRRLDQVYGKKPSTTASSLSAIQELQQVTDSLEKEKQSKTKKKESALTSPTNSGIYAVVKNGKVTRLSFGTSSTTTTAIPIPSSKKNLETPKHQTKETVTTKPYQKKLSPAVQKLTHAFTRIQSSNPSHNNSKKSKYGGGASFLSPESSVSNFSITSSSLYSKNSTSSIGNKQEPCQFCNSLALKTTLNLSSDQEKIPEFLAMNAIKRIITRKDDSGEEGDDDDSPEEEDQQSSNNQVEDEFDFLPEQNHDNTTTGAEQEASYQDQIASNPFFANTCLRESGALIILANAMVHTMSCTAETIASHNNNNSKTKMRTNSNYCDVCLQNLLKRAKTLASILDEACCLTPQNSDMIVRETLLVETLVTTIQVISQNQNSSRMILSRQESLEEILLCCLKMLTSITHENSFAGDKVLREANKSNKNKNKAQNHSFISSLPSFFSTSNFYYPSSKVTGFSIIFDVLYETVRRKQFMQNEKNSDDQDDEDDFIVNNTSTATAAYINTEKRMYDTIIFCLNSLTNVCECRELLSDAQKQIMSKKVLYVNEFEMHDEEPALVWLAKWLVSETKSYRDAILNAMPSTPSKNDEEIDDGDGEKKNGNKDTSSKKKRKKKVMEERDLSKQEQESLVIAGNGFVLLVCLMKISSSKSPLSSFSFQPLSSSSRSNFGNSHCNQKDEKDFVTKIRQSVLCQMPKINAVENTADENEVDKKGAASSTDGGISFMIRVLKAFLNFYHYSIGDLSVAVVEPVLKLVEELKNM